MPATVDFAVLTIIGSIVNALAIKQCKLNYQEVSLSAADRYN